MPAVINGRVAADERRNGVNVTIPRHERAVFTFKEAGCWLLIYEARGESEISSARSR